ncbi:MAG: nucleotidyltransferase family protein [Thermodesulfobacteriota bacterium]
MNKTALELSPEEWKKYNPFSVSSKPIEGYPSMHGEALDVARKAAKILRETFGANKVILFGSLCSPSHFGPHSDIDLAVWGISSEYFYKATATITGMSSQFRIELIDPCTCRPSIKESILKEGKEI